MKKVLSVILILFLIAVIGAGVVFAIKYSEYKKFITTPVSSSTEKVDFTISEGQTVEEIITALESKGLITNALYFRLYLKQTDIASKIQAGTFRVPLNITPKDLADELQHASRPDIWVTIPESLMTTQIADILDTEFQAEGNSSFKKDEFLELAKHNTIPLQLGIPIPEEDVILEGYIYPDTYRFPPDSSAEYVLTAILHNFKTKIYDKYKTEIDGNELGMYGILNLASILERETKHPDDRPIVADILIRRLDNNWPLGVDATLLYHFGDWKHEITWGELQLDTPYNTRKNTGLPPTPICNPGEQTIKAILEPQQNDYWFYVSDSDGVLHYAKTQAEHESNIQQYVN